MVLIYTRKIQTVFHKQVLLLIAFILFVSTQLIAQNLGLVTSNPASFNADKLSEFQIRQLGEEMQNTGKNWEQVKVEMLKNKIPESEIEKLAQRLQKQSFNTSDAKTAVVNSGRNWNIETDLEANTGNSTFISAIYGASLFRNKQYNFQPNLKIATPLNYVLGPEDEIVIDLSGYSDATYSVKISPDGQARIPMFGSVFLAASTIEQATKKIKSHLSKYNPSIQSGQTKLSITLGNIRSIKVVLLGEVLNPGTYTLPSLATVFNALYAAGGPNDDGSFRTIKLIRNNQHIATMDIYDFLMTGATKGNIRLQDQDIVKVEPYISRIQLAGQVKHPGLFELKPTETLKDLIYFAGGFTPDAYKALIQVNRNDGLQKSIANVKQSEIQLFKPENGDAYFVNAVLDRFKNRIQIEGAVFRPGYFALESTPTITDLLNNAGGLKEDALTTRAILYRLNPDNSQEIISLNIGAILAGKSPNIQLKREDKLIVASMLQMQIPEKVYVTGEVLVPGNFDYGTDMVLEDVLVLAGGVKIGADTKRIQVSRRAKDANKLLKEGKLAEVNTIEINNNLADLRQFKLEPFDQIHVFSSSNYQPLKSISIQGEVLYPGTYSLLKNNESISEIMKRSGGLTANAFPEGAVLIRTRPGSEVDNIKDKKSMMTLFKLNKKGTDDSLFQEQSEMNQKDVIGLNLNKILSGNRTSADLVLAENDVLYIPSFNPLVTVNGQVLYPNQLKYKKQKSFKKYVSEAGGFTSKSSRRKAYIVYQNGTAKSTKNYLFFNCYPKVQPGSEIIVPSKPEHKSLTTVEAISITTSMTTLMVLILNFIK